MQPLPQPVLQPIENTDNMQVVQTFVVDLPVLKKRLTILPGFETDGASIPRLFWSCAGEPFSPHFVAAAVCHDALYAAELCTRDQADDTFLELLEIEGLSWFHRNLFWVAVRVAGSWAAWDDHTPKTIAAARNFCSLAIPPAEEKNS